jgi:hypothetical protein
MVQVIYHDSTLESTLTLCTLLVQHSLTLTRKENNQWHLAMVQLLYRPSSMLPWTTNEANIQHLRLKNSRTNTFPPAWLKAWEDIIVVIHHLHLYPLFCYIQEEHMDCEVYLCSLSPPIKFESTLPWCSWPVGPFMETQTIVTRTNTNTTTVCVSWVLSL